MTPARRRAVTPRALLISAAVVVVALFAALGLDRCTSPSSASGPRAGVVATPHSGLPTVAASSLPPQAQAMLVLIDKGGPFQYAQDDTVFGNFEGLLPKRASGYYHEYTVPTPGSSDRGERRLVVGRDGDVYYTGDHYNSFRQVLR